MASILVQVKAAARIAMYLMLAFFAISLWQDPAGSAQATIDFIKAVGNFFSSLVEKLATFVRGLFSAE